MVCLTVETSCDVQLELLDAAGTIRVRVRSEDISAADEGAYLAYVNSDVNATITAVQLHVDGILHRQSLTAGVAVTPGVSLLVQFSLWDSDGSPRNDPRRHVRATIEPAHAGR
jgi:predicted Abi (CAAX) family protease